MSRIDFSDEEQCLMAAKLALKEAENCIAGSDKKHPPFNMTDSYTLKGLAQSVIRLQARIKELEEQNRWIPVSERLPNNGGSRLLAYGKDGYGYKIVAATSYDEEFKKFRILTDVTHWKLIYLPEQALKGSEN